MNHLQKHYVECRWRHARQVEEDSFSDAVEKLQADFEDYIEDYSRARQISPSKDFQYMPRWINVLEDRTELAD